MAIRRERFARAPRRTTDWGTGPGTLVQAITTSGKTLWNVGTSPVQNFTVIRTRGLVSTYLTVAGGIGEGFEGAHGIYMMTEDAFAVGVTAASDPLADADSDNWLWYSYFNQHAITATISDGVNALACVQRIVIDSKAMRKDFDPEMVMVGVTGVIEIGTSTLQVHARSRQLLKS